MIQRQIFSSRIEASAVLAQDLATCLLDACSARERATLALSGGRTPEMVLPPLAETDIDWQAVTLTLADERWAQLTDPRSNEGQARRLLGRAAEQARFVGLKTAAPTPEEGREETEARLQTLPWPLDAAFLGMGEDGHVASLFPGEMALWQQAPGLCVPVPPTGDRIGRMSLSPAALLNVCQIFLVAFGAEKRRILDRALKPGPANELPIRLVLNQDRTPVRLYLAD